MNKELVNKFKKEFDYWLKGNIILVYDNGKWVDIGENTNIWEIAHNEARFVINDKYVKFRKAILEGETVQCCLLPNPDMQSGIEFIANRESQWKNIEESHFIKGYATSHYRIKPNEPKIKIGDWVREIITGKISKANINNIRYGLPEGYERWEPKVDECWFNDVCSDRQ